MISKVIFIGDPYRGEQAVNIEKTRNLFSSVLRQLGVVDQICITDVNRSLDRDFWIPVWQESLKKYPGPFASSIDITDSAIIGFEVPEAELDYFNQQNIPWINLRIHPLRFLDDLYFDVATSFPFDATGISASLGLIDFCVNKFAKCDVDKIKPPAQKKLLVCGQHWIDRSIYFDGDFRGLDYYISRLDDIARDFDRVLYKPHPFWISKKIADMMSARYQAQDCGDENIYELFANRNLSAVAAISSSVLTEAPYFGIQSLYLEPRAKRYGPAVSYRALLDNSEFWEVGLLRRKAFREALKISEGVPPNYLRRVFPSWGFVTDEARVEERITAVEIKLKTAEALVEGRIAAVEKTVGTAKALVEEHIAAAEREAGTVKALIQSCEQRAAAAEALAEELEKRAATVEVLVKEYWQQACTLEAERNAMRQSASWRITAPLRFAAGLVIHPVRTLSSGANVVIHRTICIAERPLSRLMTAVLRMPQLSHRINSWLLRYPALHQQLIDVARRGGVVPGASVYSTPAGQVEMHMSPDLANLTPRARQIYADLQAAIKNSKGTS